LTLACLVGGVGGGFSEATGSDRRKRTPLGISPLFGLRLRRIERLVVSVGFLDLLLEEASPP
jgi:hypothetical protein